MRPEVSVLFCDDIRFEQSGKMTLVGVYGAAIVFLGPAAPQVMPKLGALLTIRWAEGAPRRSLDAELRLTGTSPTTIARMPIDVAEMPVIQRAHDPMGPGIATAMVFEMVPVAVGEAYQLILHEEGQERVVGRLFIDHNPIVQPPPQPVEEPATASKPRRRRRT